MQSKDTIVKLKVQNANIVKRIPVPANFDQLKQQASALLHNQPVMITYIDADGDNVEVIDNSDFSLSL